MGGSAAFASFEGASPDQIAVLGALNNPAFADSYKDILIALSRSDDLELYERVISELKESSQQNQEDYQHNLDTLVGMFHKAVDSLRDTSIAFSGQPPQSTNAE